MGHCTAKADPGFFMHSPADPGCFQLLVIGNKVLRQVSEGAYVFFLLGLGALG